MLNPRGTRRILSRKQLGFALLVIVIFLLVYGLRVFRIDESFDVFIDEITYFRLAETTRLTGWPTLYNQPFYLHPPAFFYLQALFLSVVNSTGDLFQQIYTARHFNAILAALTALYIFALVRRVAGTMWGVWASIVFALDSFVIRMNSMNLLDTCALHWVTLGFTIIILSVRPDTRSLPLNSLIASGVAFGLGLLTKDMTFFLSIAPLGGMLITGWFLTRRDSFLLMLITSLTYSVYIFAVILVGEWPSFYDDKLGGITRLAGVHQETGINREGGPSFVEKLIERLSEFGVTYVLIGLGALAVIFLLLWGRREQRIVATWGAGAYVLLTYAILFGTLEEQFFYFLIVPCIVLTIFALARLMEMLNTYQYLKRLMSLCLVFLVAAFFVVSGREWVNRHFNADDGYARMHSYIEQNISAAGSVASSSETGQFLLEQYSTGPWGLWSSTEDLMRDKPGFVLLSYDQIAWDFGKQAEPMLRWVATHGTKRFELDYRSNHLVLFEIDYPQTSD